MLGRAVESGSPPSREGCGHLLGAGVPHPTWPGLRRDRPSAMVAAGPHGAGHGAGVPQGWWDAAGLRIPHWGGDSSGHPTAPSGARRWPLWGRDGCTSPFAGHRVMRHWDPALGMLGSCTGGTGIPQWVLWGSGILPWGHARSLGAPPNPTWWVPGKQGPISHLQPPSATVTQVSPQRALRVLPCPRRSSPAWASATPSTRGGRAGRC